MSPKAGRTHHITIADKDGSPTYGFMYPPARNGKRRWTERDSRVLQPRVLSMGEITHAELPADLELIAFQEAWQGGIGGINYRLHPGTLADSVKIDGSSLQGNLRLMGDRITPANDSAPSEFVPSGFAAHGDQVWAFQGKYPFQWDFANTTWDRKTIPTGFDTANSIIRNAVSYNGNHYAPRWADDTAGGGHSASADEPSIYWYKDSDDAQWTSSTIGNDATENDAFKYFTVANNTLYGGYAVSYADTSENTTHTPQVDAVSTGSATEASSVTLSGLTIDAAGINRLLVVGVAWEKGSSGSFASVSGVTWAGDALTKLGGTTTSSTNGVDLWYRLNPDTGNNSLVVTMSASQDSIGVGAISVENVNQSTPLGTASTATATSSTPSVSPASVAGDLVVDFVCHSTANAGTPDGSQTERFDFAANGLRATSSTEVASGTSTVMNWSGFSSSGWVQVAAAIKLVAPDADDTAIYTTAAPASNISAGDVLRIDTEYMLATAVSDDPPRVTVTRGYRGTAGAAHANAANIYKATLNTHYVHGSTDGTNSGAWDTGTEIGDASAPITGLVGLDTDLFIFKTDGIYRLESDGTVTNLRPSLQTTNQPDQFRNAIAWNNRVLMPLHGGGLWEMDIATFDIQDISFSLVMPEQTQYHGQIVAFAGSSSTLYCMIQDTGSTIYHILSGTLVNLNGVTAYRWHHMTDIKYTTNTDGDHSAMLYEAVTGDNGHLHDRLLMGVESTGSNLVPMFIPISSTDAQWAYTNDTSSDDGGEPIAYTTVWDGNLPSVNKRAQEITVETANLGASDGTNPQIEVQYRVDYDGTSSGSFPTEDDWEYITGAQGTSNLTTTPQTISFGDNITGKLWEFRFLFERGSTATTTSELNNFTAKFQLRPESVRAFPIRVYLADHQSTLNGRETRVKSKLAQLKSWNDGANEVTLVVGDVPTTTTSYTCVFIPGSLQIERIGGYGPGRRHEYIVGFQLAEVG